MLRLKPGEPVPILPMVWRWEYGRKPASWYYPRERAEGVHLRPENRRKRWWACPRSSPPLLPDEWWPPYRPPAVCVVWEATHPYQWERHISRDPRKAMAQRDAIEVAQTRQPSGLRCEVVVWIETDPVADGKEAEALVESFGPEFDRGRDIRVGAALEGLAAVHAGKTMSFTGSIQANNITGLRDQWRRMAKRWLAGRAEETIRCGLAYVRVGSCGGLRPLEPPSGGSLRCPRCKWLLTAESALEGLDNHRKLSHTSS